ncbi:dihydrofolate reductase [Candidatus Daviesbacteria bacterium]|nr:dihydrofolate reductase [Candidatus Daviesbacteria bacterium]
MGKGKISIIVAMDSKRGIGKGNTLLWHIPDELRRFREITTGHPIIMGRKTFESIGRPLPNRTNIVITRDPDFKAEGIIVVHSLEEGLKLGQKYHDREIFVIGGGQIFEQALPLADKLYVTQVEGDFNATVFFPEYKHLFTKKVSEKEMKLPGIRPAVSFSSQQNESIAKLGKKEAEGTKDGKPKTFKMSKALFQIKFLELTK